jgi:hypothetical protein
MVDFIMNDRPTVVNSYLMIRAGQKEYGSVRHRSEYLSTCASDQ